MAEFEQPPARALLLDLDGTIVDTERVSGEEFCRASCDLGFELQLPDLAELFGKRVDAVNQGLLEMMGPDYPIAEIRERQAEYVAGRYEREGVQPIEGMPELLAHLEHHEVPRAVGTSSNRESGFGKLRKAGLIHRIPSLTGGDNVERSKPAPDTWLVTLENLNRLLEERGIAQLQAAECVVAGDSDNDILSGHAAGMRTVRIPGIVPIKDDVRALADFVAESMREASDYLCHLLRIPRLSED